jgi:hypothetical protein
LPENCGRLQGRWESNTTLIVITADGYILYEEPGKKISIPGSGDWEARGDSFTFSTPRFCCFAPRYFEAEIDEGGQVLTVQVNGALPQKMYRRQFDSYTNMIYSPNR